MSSPNIYFRLNWGWEGTGNWGRLTRSSPTYSFGSRTGWEAGRWVRGWNQEVWQHHIPTYMEAPGSRTRQGTWGVTLTLAADW